MWLSTNKGFLSIVAHADDENALLVRARRCGDIESLFPDVLVKRTPGRDYLYRASIPRAVVAATVAASLCDIKYGNFKASVKDANLHHAYHRVWDVMADLQAIRPYGRDSAAARKREGLPKR